MNGNSSTGEFARFRKRHANLFRNRSHPFINRSSSTTSTMEDHIFNEPVMVICDSDEEERNINQEISSLYNEFDRIQNMMNRTRSRLRKLYERREKIRIKRAIRQREIDIRRNMQERWLPSIERVQQNTARVQSNVLNLISAPIQPQDQLNLYNESRASFSDDDLPTAQEILDQVCSSGININDVD